ncbi:DUF2059 domain-containing protein [Myxococcota bacterium]|nr:DUF2059 domain-containing protein [Myxococcota bacterium]
MPSSRFLAIALFAAVIHGGAAPKARAGQPPPSGPPRLAAAPTGDEALRAEIRDLLELTGAGALASQVADQLIQSMAQGIPGAPEGFWQAFRARLDMERLTEEVVDVYARHLTIEDVRELVTFYRTPVGRKLVAILPAVTQESMAAGQRWGEDAARQALEGLKAEGVLPP